MVAKLKFGEPLTDDVTFSTFKDSPKLDGIENNLSNVVYLHIIRDKSEGIGLPSSRNDREMPSELEIELRETVRRHEKSNSRDKSLGDCVLTTVDEFNLAALLDTKPRDFDSSRESLFDYILSEDGLGLWHSRKILTQTFMRRNAPKSYWALMNFQRGGKPLPDGITILTKADEMEARLRDPAKVREARATARADERKRAPQR